MPVDTKGILLVQRSDAPGARLRTALSRQPELEVIDEVPDTRTAVETARRVQPDVVVMNVGLSDVAGNGVLGSLREVAPGARVVLHAHAARSDGPGSRYWTGRLVDVVVDSARSPVFEARLELPDEPRSVPLARGLLGELLGQWELDEFVASASLLLTELVANAVRHVPGPCAVELTHSGGVLRVAVVDTGPGMPDLQVLGASRIGGRGLHIVTSLSTSWGVDHLEDGCKAVWAELDSAAQGAVVA